MLLPACSQRLPFLPGPVILGAACLLRAVAAGGTRHLSFDSPGLMKEFEGPTPREALGWGGSHNPVPVYAYRPD